MEVKTFWLAIYFVSLNLISTISNAQYNDAGLWVGFNLEKKITRTTSLLFTQELRMSENISQVGTFFSDFGIARIINKYFSVSFAYRFIEKRKMDATYSSRHRFYMDVVGKYKIKKISLSLRERIQAQIQDYYSSESGHLAQWYLRSKFSMKYRINKKVTPMIAAEFAYQLNNPEGNEFEYMRFTVGVDYAFNKRHSIEPFYLIQQEMHVNNPVTDFISGISYNLSF